MWLFKYLFIFGLFSMVGWVLEFIFRSITTKRVVNPGFMSGCVVPLYGLGALIMTLVCNLFQLFSFKYEVILVFFTSTILLTALECLSGYITEKFYHVKLWDYSDMKYNFKGYVCPLFSLIWGLLALVFYIFIYPKVNIMADNFINNIACIFLLGIFSGVFIVDLCVSIRLMNRITKYAVEIKETINIEKLKINARMQSTRKHFLNTIYPYLATNRYIRERLRGRR